jgi:four helix bundle protein
MNQYKNLIVWQKSIDLAAAAYDLSAKLPAKERFNLIPQINSSASSIASNIAEGAGRNTKKDFDYFLSIAVGSSYELDTRLKICIRLKFLTEQEVESTFKLIDEIQKMLYGLKNNLKGLPGKKKVLSSGTASKDSQH